MQTYGTLHRKLEPAAVAAFVLSLVGVFTWGLSNVLALFLAPRAKQNVAVAPELRKGKGFAVAAQWISAATLTLAAIITILLLTL